MSASTTQELVAAFKKGSVPDADNFTTLINAAAEGAALVEVDGTAGLALADGLLSVSATFANGLLSPANIAKLAPTKRAEIFAKLQESYLTVNPFLVEASKPGSGIVTITFGAVPNLNAWQADRSLVVGSGSSARYAKTVDVASNSFDIPHSDLLDVLTGPIALETRLTPPGQSNQQVFTTDAPLVPQIETIRSACLALSLDRSSSCDSVECVGIDVANDGTILLTLVETRVGQSSKTISIGVLRRKTAPEAGWYDSFAELLNYQSSDNPTAAIISADGSTVYAIGDDGRVHCIDPSAIDPIAPFIMPLPDNPASYIAGLSCSYHGTSFAVLYGPDATGAYLVQTASTGVGGSVMGGPICNVRNSTFVQIADDGALVLASNPKAGTADLCIANVSNLQATWQVRQIDGLAWQSVVGMIQATGECVVVSTPPDPFSLSTTGHEIIAQVLNRDGSPREDQTTIYFGREEERGFLWGSPKLGKTDTDSVYLIVPRGSDQLASGSLRLFKRAGQAPWIDLGTIECEDIASFRATSVGFSANGQNLVFVEHPKTPGLGIPQPAVLNIYNF